MGGIAVACDLGDAAAIDAMVDQVRTEFGSIDVLFNNAGIASGKGPLDSPLDEWQRRGRDERSVAAPTPPLATLLGWARAMLNLTQ